MAKAVLIPDDGLLRQYRIPNGDKYYLRLNEEWSQITFYDDEFHKLEGEFDFKDEDENESQSRFLLARMYCPVAKSGLGRAAVEFFKDITKATVYARPNDGIAQDDGSHLTGDAPSFVSKLIFEKILEEPQQNEN